MTLPRLSDPQAIALRAMIVGDAKYILLDCRIATLKSLLRRGLAAEVGMVSFAATQAGRDALAAHDAIHAVRNPPGKSS